mmetsp:Transcript_94920/g.186220  ORF Transcript_94920/g.186220 Transcript_94920/m.186220 type:complete len:270 (+) Transcript_94920:76-885(+)
MATEDATLNQTRQMVLALQHLQQQQALAAQRARAEEEAHAATRQLLAVAEAGHEETRKAHAEERVAHAGVRDAHAAAQAELEMLREARGKSDQEISLLREENSKLRVDLEALRHELTAQKARAAETQQEYEMLHASHSQAKAALEAALQAQEAYRKQYYSTREALERERIELPRQSEALLAEQERAMDALRAELDSNRSYYAELNQRNANLVAQLSDTKKALSERDGQLAGAQRELEAFRSKERDINFEFSKVQDMLQTVLVNASGQGA